MSLSVVELHGVQAPRVRCLPDGEAWTDGDDAAFLSSSYGLEPDPWQADVVSGWLARRADGRLAAGRCGLAVPRQNGKNGAVEERELFGMVALAERFLHTAHEVKTSRKAFLRLASFFENPNFPELQAMVTDIRRTNGQEAIILANGGSCEFVARSRGSGRGFTVDVLVLDEAQELTDEQLEALMPTISAAPKRDPQIIMTGTPPPPGSPGEVFARTRAEAHETGGGGRLRWDEWGVESADVDADDPEVWAACNPGLGRRLLESTVADERAAMSHDGFLRERLGLWTDASVSAVIPAGEWEACATSAPPSSGRVAYGLDMSPDRSTLALSAARLTEDGVVHGETVQHRSTGRGTDWAVEWLAERWSKAVAVVIDAQSPAMSLLPALEDARVKVTVTNSADMVKACGMLVDSVRDGTFSHFDQPALNEAVQGAAKRNIGQAGGWGWDRKRLDVDITPLVSVTLAAYGVRVGKRRPGRKSRMVRLP